MAPREVLRMRQHLVHAAARLDRAGHRQGVVGLHQGAAGDGHARDSVWFGQFRKRRLDQTRGGFKLGKQLGERGRPVAQKLVGGDNVLTAQAVALAGAGERRRGGRYRGIAPGQRAPGTQARKQPRIQGGQRRHHAMPRAAAPGRRRTRTAPIAPTASSSTLPKPMMVGTTATPALLAVE